MLKTKSFRGVQEEAECLVEYFERTELALRNEVHEGRCEDSEDTLRSCPKQCKKKHKLNDRTALLWEIALQLHDIHTDLEYLLSNPPKQWLLERLEEIQRYTGICNSFASAYRRILAYHDDTNAKRGERVGSVLIDLGHNLNYVGVCLKVAIDLVKKRNRRKEKKQ